MARKKTLYNNTQAAMDWIKKSLGAYPNGMTENQLNTRHDPSMIAHLLDLMVTRNIITRHIDSTKTGSARKLYKLTGKQS